MAGDQSVALQVAQSLGEHALGDVADGSVKLAEALRSRRERHDHEYAPFVADAVEHVAHRAMYGFCRVGVVRLISLNRSIALNASLMPVPFFSPGYKNLPPYGAGLRSLCETYPRI